MKLIIGDRDMGLKEVKVMVPEKSYELGQGMKRFVAEMKNALEDGWQTGQDLPVALSSAMENLVPHVKNYQEILDEVTMEPIPSIRGGVLTVTDIYEALK